MTNISHIDQAIILLRERLRQARKQGPSAASASPIKVQSLTAQPIEQLRRLLSVEALPPRELRRALVRSLLAEAFGEEVGNDLSFQALSDRVTTMLDEDDETRQLIDRAIAELSASR